MPFNFKCPFLKSLKRNLMILNLRDNSSVLNHKIIKYIL